jgi:hypothetical protein
VPIETAGEDKRLLTWRKSTHQRRAAAAYERAGEKLARRAERRFTAADNLAELPY